MDSDYAAALCWAWATAGRGRLRRRRAAAAALAPVLALARSCPYLRPCTPTITTTYYSLLLYMRHVPLMGNPLYPRPNGRTDTPTFNSPDLKNTRSETSARRSIGYRISQCYKHNSH
eukprot:scaffold4022_cov122-Isochrysis_galbana.AAC.8